MSKQKAPKKTEKSFEESLWDTANKLRGSVESSEYKHVVLSLIFLKFVSDKFEERRAELVAEGKEDYLDMVEFYTMQNVFYLPETSRWSYIQQHAKQGDIAIKIDSALTAVEKSNASLKGALPDNYFSRLGLDGSKLSALIDAINNIDTVEDKEEDTVGRVYEPSGARQTATSSPKGERGGANQYLIRKFAEGGGQSAGEWSGATWTTRQGCPEGERGGVHQFYTPPEVGTIMSRVLQPEPGMEIYDPTCGSGGLLVKCEIAMEESAKGKKRTVAPLKLFGQEFTPETWAMANMNMIIHDMEGQIEIGDTFKNPKFRHPAAAGARLRTFDRVVATAPRDSARKSAKPLRRASLREDNPMWNQDWFAEADYDNDTAQRDSASSNPEGKPQSVPEGQDKLDRFPAGAGFPGKSSADCPSLCSRPAGSLRYAPNSEIDDSAWQWGWVQHMHASLKSEADGQKADRAAVVLDTGAASRGSGNAGANKEKTVRQWFVDHDLIESVLYLPEPSGARQPEQSGDSRRQTARQGSPKGERGGANQNLFYNTTAPGIVLFLNRDKPMTRQGEVFLVNASQVFAKGDPSRAERDRSRDSVTRRVNAGAFINNFIPDAGIQRIADTLIGWKEEEKLSRIVDHATARRDSASKKVEGNSQVVSEARDNLKKNDYNISPSRYIHTSDAETYRPIAEIVEELKVIEAEARETDKALGKILKQLGV